MRKNYFTVDTVEENWTMTKWIDKELLERKVILQQVAAGLEPALTTLLSAAERTFLSATSPKSFFRRKLYLCKDS